MLRKRIELAQRKIAKAIHRTPTGLSQTGRVFRFEVLLRDVPGALVTLTALVALKHANILHIIHERAARDIPIGFSRVILVLEAVIRPISGRFEEA
jgi:hypothetical protein